MSYTIRRLVCMVIGHRWEPLVGADECRRCGARRWNDRDIV
jgi:hypothetical protein